MTDLLMNTIETAMGTVTFWCLQVCTFLATPFASGVVSRLRKHGARKMAPNFVAGIDGA